MGWINTDSSWNAHLQRVPLLGKIMQKSLKTVEYNNNNLAYMNLNKRWGFKDNSVDIVYASHLFEHLKRSSANLFLSEAYRVLKPGGVIRIVVPDLYKFCKQYVMEYESNQVDNPIESVMWAINMHREGQYGPNIGWWKKFILELQGYPHLHKFMYDEKSLREKMKNHGFTDIVSSAYGKSAYIKEIAEVEATKEIYFSVYLEAKKKSV